MAASTSRKKRNPQDATRGHDVAPIRRRVEKLEEAQRQSNKKIAELERRLAAVESEVH